MAAGASCEGIARNPDRRQRDHHHAGGPGGGPDTIDLRASGQLHLLFKAFPESQAIAAAMAFLAAGICTGFGGIGPGIGNGMAAEGAVKWVARNTAYAGDLMRTMLVGQAVSQSTAIYAMVISLVLIFVV